MRRTHRWLLAAPLVALLLTTAPRRARADETEDRAVLLIERVGGSVVRDRDAAGQPIVAVKLSGAKLDPSLMQAVASFRNLKGLDLSNCPRLNGRYLKQLEALPELQSINLSHNPGVHGHFVAKMAAFKNLRYLDISHCEDIDECGLEAIARHFKQLQHLDISGCREVTDDALRELGANKQLEVLHMANCEITDVGLKTVAGLALLRTVNIAGCPKVTNTGVRELAILANLDTLNISGCDKLNTQVFRDVNGFKELRHLDASRTKVYPFGMSGLAKLETLNISGAKMASHALKQLANLKALQVLRISDCSNLHDYGMEYLVHSAPQLQVLDISGCEHLTDNGVKELTALKQLQSLNVCRCGQVSEAGANAVVAALPRVKVDR